MKYEVPIWEKSNLTIEEAAAYSGIGMNKLRELSDCILRRPAAADALASGRCAAGTASCFNRRFSD